jgi:ADP-ribose pyrophosphatase YjhB (NUDIX family)
MNNSKRSAGILVKCGNEVLLCKRSENERYGGYWSVPSGHLNPNETPIKGAVREFFEETDIKVSNDIELLSFIEMGKSIMYVFLWEVDNKIFPDLKLAKDGHEHSQCGWFNIDDLPTPIGEKLLKVIKISQKISKNQK